MGKSVETAVAEVCFTFVFVFSRKTAWRVVLSNNNSNCLSCHRATTG